MTLTSICEVVMSGPTEGIGEWSKDSWADNIQGLLEDALGFPSTIIIKVRTVSIDITHISDHENTTGDDNTDFHRRMALINAFIKRDEDVPAALVRWLLQQTDWDAHV